MLSPQRYERLHQLFTAVCELQAQERAAFLDRECADDPSLREKVQALLAKDADTGPFMEQPALGEDFELAADGRGPRDLDERAGTNGIAEGPGTTIGPYKILQLIGEGGFGAVYMAEQEKPLRRRVALKIIKLGMDTKQVIARFEVERQALAMMDHPNIAKVFDAGATASGGPYFVMELVKGVPLTEYCDDNQLTMRQRIDLFMPVCHALQHAHQKGIIHRDVKPSNVMVTLHDGRPVPKVIDFGIAKATNARLTEKTMFTDFHQLIGTPAYMSPEQAEMSGLDVDTRSDIYSLGVLLYELLTGTTPFDPNHLRSVPYDEIQRIIREEEPEKPSTRISSLARPSTDGASKDATSSIQQIAKHRQDDPVHLMKSLRGDLDWIVMKALEKDRTRRYETANGLALDIQRYLNHEPVLAGPPSRAYRLRKFVRRNRAGVAAGSVVAVSLIVAAGVSVGFAFSEAEQRRIAGAEATRADEAALKATEEKDIAQAVNEFLNDDLLAAVAPSAEQGKGKDVLMREVLDEAAKRIEKASGVGGRFQDKALVEASIRQTLGETYRKLGEYPAAEPHLERARELRRHVLGEDHPDTLLSIHSLASLYQNQGRYDEAESLYLQAIEVRKRVLGEEHPDTLRSMNNLANVHVGQGRYDDAAPLHLETLEMQKRVLGEDHLDTLLSMSYLAIAYWKQGRYGEAEPLFLETLELQKRVLGEEHPDTLTSMNGLAAVYFLQDRYDDAEPLFLDMLEIRRRVLGEEHPSTLRAMNNLASLYSNRGGYDEAESLYLQAVEVEKRVLGEAHPSTLMAMGNLASLYKNRGRYDEAETLYLETLKMTKRVLGEEHPGALSYMNGLADLYWNQYRYDEAEQLYLEMIEICKRVHGEEHLLTLYSMDNLAILYKEQGRYDEAEPLFLQALEIFKRVQGEVHQDTLVPMTNLVYLYVAQGRYEQAESLAGRALEVCRDVLGKEHHETLNAQDNFGFVLLKAGRVEEAETLFRSLVATTQRVLGENDGLPPYVRAHHGMCLVELGRYEEAELLLLEAYPRLEKPLPDVDTREALRYLVKLYETWGKPDKAAEWRAKLPTEQEAVGKD